MTQTVLTLYLLDFVLLHMMSQSVEQPMNT